LLPRRPDWTDSLLNFFFEWLAKVSLVAVASFLPGRAKDLSTPRYCHDSTCCLTRSGNHMHHPVVCFKSGCCVHKPSQPYSISIHINEVHTLPPYPFKIHFNIIIPSTPRYLNRFILYRSSDQNYICIFEPTYKLQVQLISPYVDRNIVLRTALITSLPSP